MVSHNREMLVQNFLSLQERSVKNGIFMKLNKTLEQALNQQLMRELEAAYLYLSMAAYCETIAFPGVAGWLKVQSKEELGHAMKIYTYLSERGSQITLAAIAAPKASFASLIEVFECALKNEVDLGEHFNSLYALAQETKDPATGVFLQWFLTEQVEEVSLCTMSLEKVKRAGTSGPALLMLDKELGARQE